MSYINPTATQIITEGVSRWQDSIYKAQEELLELKEWLRTAHPEVFKQYKCVKDITE